MNPLRLYVNPAYERDMARVSPLMYPIWNTGPQASISYSRALTEYQFDTRYYEIVTDPDVCDCHFLPFNIWSLEKKNSQEFSEALAAAERHGKKLLVDAYGDTMRSIDDPRTIVLRFAQYRRDLTPRDIILPAYIEDLCETYKGGELTHRHKNKKPIVGFVGWAKLPFLKTYSFVHQRNPDLSLVSHATFVRRFSKGRFPSQQST